MGLVGGLSYFFFAAQSLRLDEAQTLWQSSRSAPDILSLVARDVHVPFYFEALHFWRYLNDSVFSARLFSLVFYLLSIPAIYFLGKLAYGRPAGLFAATLLAVSPFMNWYGNEIRMYTLFTFLVIVNQYCFLKIQKTGNEHAWAFYIISAAIGVFTHYFFWLVLVAQALFFFLRRPLFPPGALRRFIFAGAVVGLVSVPWAAMVFLEGQLANSSPLLPIPGSIDLFNAFSQFLVGFQNDHVNTFFLSLWPLSIALAFLALRKGTRLSPETEYFLLTAVLGITFAFAVSFVLPLFISRYLIFTVPSLYLLLTSFILLYPPRAAVVARTAVAGLMVVGLLIEMLNPTTPVKEEYREVAQFLSTNAQAQDVVLVSAPFTIYPVEYYYRGEATLATLPRWDRYTYGAIPPFSAETLPQEVGGATGAAQYAWLLLSYDQGYEKDIKEYFENNYEEVMTKNFSPGLNLYQYKLRYDTPLGRSPTGEALERLSSAHE